MPQRHKHDLAMLIDIDISEAESLLDALDTFGKRDAGRIAMQEVAVKGLSHALTLLDRLIYDTPQRGGYVRTRRLRRGMRTFVREETEGPVLYIINDARSKKGAPYPVYNELGTRSGFRPVDRILSQARRQLPTSLVLLEFGRVSGGLEPRPFFFPTLAFMEYQIPIELERALLRRLRTEGLR